MLIPVEPWVLVEQLESVANVLTLVFGLVLTGLLIVDKFLSIRDGIERRRRARPADADRTP